MIIFHFFLPWHYAEVENWLAAMEQDGWRLERVTWPYRFHFVSCKQKNSRYFFLFTFLKTLTLREWECEHVLKQKGANEIPVSFFHNLKIYRMTNYFDTIAAERQFQVQQLRYVYREQLYIALIFLVWTIVMLIALLQRTFCLSLGFVVIFFAFCIIFMRCCYCLTAMFTEVRQ